MLLYVIYWWAKLFIVLINLHTLSLVPLWNRHLSVFSSANLNLFRSRLSRILLLISSGAPGDILLKSLFFPFERECWAVRWRTAGGFESFFYMLISLRATLYHKRFRYHSSSHCRGKSSYLHDLFHDKSRRRGLRNEKGCFNRLKWKLSFLKVPFNILTSLCV